MTARRIDWPAHVLVLLAVPGCLGGAVAWWAASNRSIGAVALFAGLVVVTAVPLGVLWRPTFTVACYVAGGLAVLLSVLLFFMVLMWSLLGGVTLILAGLADFTARPRASWALLALGVVIAAAGFLVFVPLGGEALLHH